MEYHRNRHLTQTVNEENRLQRMLQPVLLLGEFT